MTRELRTSEQVPIGAIDDSWGSTPVRQWMDDASVRAGGEGAVADLVHLYRTNPSQALREFDKSWAQWWDTQAAAPPGQEPWHASDRLRWEPVPKIDYWDSWGPQWKSHVGAAWFRRRFELAVQSQVDGVDRRVGLVAKDVSAAHARVPSFGIEIDLDHDGSDARLRDALELLVPPTP